MARRAGVCFGKTWVVNDRESLLLTGWAFFLFVYHGEVRYLVASLLFFVSFAADAQAWLADFESGQGDAVGMMALFWLALSFVYIKGEFKISKAKGWTAVAISSGIGILAVMFEPIRIILALIFLLSFLLFAWKSLRG